MLCLECQTSVKGRSDKKFCSHHCKSNFHNKNRTSLNPEVKSINSILARNRRVLINHMNHSEQIIKLDEMKNDGFNFKYFTHQFIIDNNSTYRFCYDIGYIALSNDYVLLIMLRDFNKKYGITT